MDDEFKQAFERIDKQFAEIGKRFEGMDKRFDEMEERIHDTETKLLSSFYGWSRPIEARLKALPAIDEMSGWA